MLFSTRDSYLGFPLLLERRIEGLHFISPHLGPRPKPLPLVTALFLLKYNVVLLVVAVEVPQHLSLAHISEEGDPITPGG